MERAPVSEHIQRVVRVDREDAIVIVTIDRPETRNALDAAARAELTTALQTADADDTVYAIILTGAGDRAFASGADIAELGRRTPGEQREVMRDGSVFGVVDRLRTPIIAAINGYCLGGGLELALACDIRIAADSAKFGQPEVALGLIPGGGATQRLPRIVGTGEALRLILTGEAIDATEALRIGLVSEVVTLDELHQRAYAIAESIAGRGPVAVRAAKAAVRAALDLPFDEGLALERSLFERCFASEDKLEGIRAFLEKRPPIFPGR